MSELLSSKLDSTYCKRVFVEALLRFEKSQKEERLE